MAKNNMRSIEKLEARFLDLKKQIDELDKEKKQTGEDLIALMTEEGIKETLGIDGFALRLNEKLECDYDADTYEYVERNELAPLFTSAMKISYNKVMQLNKKNAFTLAQFTRIQKGAGEIETAYTLTQFKQKEEKEDPVKA
jgi:hypothetical protein